MRNLYKGILSLSAIVLSSIGFGQTTFSYTGSLQTYTVPAGVTLIQIEATGAAGGDNTSTSLTGGHGAYISGEFAVTPGQVLNVMVGGAGQNATHTTGGGGGSFVWDDVSSTLFIAAGGGGGCAYHTAGVDASITEDGTVGTAATDGAGTAGSGGVIPSNPQYAGGGAGWLSDGNDGTLHGCVSNCTGGQTPLAGGAGGAYGGSTGLVGAGGYGGGGGGNGKCGSVAGGGGGGYSGGGPGVATGPTSIYNGGGGGGSYNSGTSPMATAGVGIGNGEIVITDLCSGLVTTVSDDTVCVGDEVILHAESTGSGVITWSGGITDSVAFTPGAGTTTYTATSSDVMDCEFSIDIFVGDYPTADAGADTSICEGDSIQFVGAGSGNVFDWSDGITDGDWVTPATAGVNTYTLTVTVDSTGCATTDDIDVTYNVIDATVTYSAGTLSSATSGATYQWINCADSSDVAGATSQDFTPTQNGDYAVIIDLGGCVDTSACETVGDVGMIDFSTDAKFAVYPNPASDNVTIKAVGSFDYSILDATGRIVLKGEGTDIVVVNLTDFETGTYMVAIQGEDNYITKLLKK